MPENQTMNRDGDQGIQSTLDSLISNGQFLQRRPQQQQQPQQPQQPQQQQQQQQQQPQQQFVPTNWGSQQQFVQPPRESIVTPWNQQGPVLPPLPLYGGNSFQQVPFGYPTQSPSTVQPTAPVPQVQPGNTIINNVTTPQPIQQPQIVNNSNTFAPPLQYVQPSLLQPQSQLLQQQQQQNPTPLLVQQVQQQQQQQQTQQQQQEPQQPIGAPRVITLPLVITGVDPSEIESSEELRIRYQPVPNRPGVYQRIPTEAELREPKTFDPSILIQK
jgi:hypothetical protein